MNARLTELLVTPESLEPKDLELIESHIVSAPYMQSLRALQLLGIQKFQKENYTAQLSKTAAYTTDKKILYNLINPETVKVEAPAPLPESRIEEKMEQVLEKSIEKKVDKSVFEQQLQDNIVELPVIIVNNERNRILFPGEEGFMNETAAPVIDKEASFEAGKIVLSTPQKVPTISEEIAEPGIQENSTEAKTEQPQVADSSVSLYDMSAFLPGVTFKAPSSAPKTETPKEEISDVKKQSVPGIQQPAEIKQSVEVQKDAGISTEPEKEIEEKTETLYEATEEADSGWKPMSFAFNTPDALIHKQEPVKKESVKPMPVAAIEPVQVATPKDESTAQIQTTYIETSVEEENTVESSEIPVINMSFFSSNLSEPIETVEENKIEEKEPTPEKSSDSNVPTFINTWQNWLKVNRQEPGETKVQKLEVIDKFIENNPKISQLKEESSYIVKEKSNDISHLMTETLARLYFEQKLYSKAIKAYQILQEKHPEKKEQFDEVIQKIKDARSGTK